MVITRKNEMVKEPKKGLVKDRSMYKKIKGSLMIYREIKWSQILFNHGNMKIF